MTVEAPTLTQIHLDHDCCHSPLVADLYQKLNTWKYTRSVSLMPVPGSLEEWRLEHRTARKRSDRAERLGYEFGTIDRSQHNDDLYDINTSKAERQGRPMTEGYTTRHNHGPLPHYPCERHRVHTYGVMQTDTLRAYMTVYRVGELALISMILGHGDHLRNDIMYVLFSGLVQHQAELGGWFYYNRHDSGTDGLRYYKTRVGFEAGDVEWML